jgi:glycosyltransferase involved in cell wall biosynthesis
MKISVIMPSFLYDYPGAAKDREGKFLRAVNSFLIQDYEDKELIIVSDGCDITNRNCVVGENVINIMLEKQIAFSGNVRNAGLEGATGDIITYLDTDDYYEQEHLKSIVENFNDNDWVYWDDYAMAPNYVKHRRNTELRFAKIGTSCIAHKKNDVKWGDGYGHDFEFIKQLTGKREKIETAGYVVCHINGKTDV